MALDTLRSNQDAQRVDDPGHRNRVMTVITISSVVNGLNQSVAGLVESLGSMAVLVSVSRIYRTPDH